jgi:hypothetical protein
MTPSTPRRSTLKPEYPSCHANFDLQLHLSCIHFDEFVLISRTQSARERVSRERYTRRRCRRSAAYVFNPQLHPSADALGYVDTAPPALADALGYVDTAPPALADALGYVDTAPPALADALRYVDAAPRALAHGWATWILRLRQLATRSSRRAVSIAARDRASCPRLTRPTARRASGAVLRQTPAPRASAGSSG